MGRAAQKNRKIEAEKFVLRDASGKSRVKLRVWEGGAPNLISLDKEETVRSAPGLSKIGERGLGVDSLYRGKKQAGIRLLIARNGAPSLKRIDEQGRARTVPGSTALKTAQTGVVEKRAPTSLLLFGENGKVLFDAMSNE